MNIDEIDLKILRSFIGSEKDFTTTDLARKVFNIKNNHDLQLKDTYIRNKLKKLVKYNAIVTSTRNNKTIYKINPDSIGYGSLDICTDNDKYVIDTGYFFVIRFGDKIAFAQI